MELRTIQSDYFFEKYMVVGVSDDTLTDAQAMANFNYNYLKPSILFREPDQSQKINGKKYLIEDDTVDDCADFCFPNGVPVVKMFDLSEDMSFEEREKKTE